MKAREAAFIALTSKELLEESLASYQPTQILDLKLAKELAFGTMKRLLTLDHLAKRLTITGKLNLSASEKMLLRLAIYQFVFMDRVPGYAIVHETVDLAKRYFGPKTASFFNAILRKAPSLKLEPIDDLSYFYSYPTYFIKQLIKAYGLAKTKEILDVQNHFYPPYVRHRKKGFFQLTDEDLQTFTSDPNYYIQNATPIHLIQTLAKGIKSPRKILDLCAAPGGKLLLCHDLFPDAELFANDLKSLQENLHKYHIKAHVTSQRAETFISSEKFDLILLDVPCSNSGVLHKRPEARWRLEKKNLQQLISLQKAILQNALSLLAPGGQIWYLTCSILPDENESVVAPFHPAAMHTILPNRDGWDGGFAAVISYIPPA